MAGLVLAFFIAGLASGSFAPCPTEPEAKEGSFPAYAPVFDLKSQERIAVYVYNIGGYENDGRREDLIPNVPADVDAYYLLDGPTFRTLGKQGEGMLEAWRAKGWEVMSMQISNATLAVSANRLTSKLAKFTPPEEIIANHSWVVTFDSNMYVDLYKLRPFLSSNNRSDAPLLMLDWRHWTGNYDDSGYDSMMKEIRSFLPGGILQTLLTTTASRENTERWYASMEKMRAHVSDANDLFPNYYDTSIMFRNMKHPNVSKVAEAFTQVTGTMRYIERDQIVLPRYLREHGLNQQVHMLRLDDLQAELGHCKVAEHAKEHGSFLQRRR